MQTKRKPKGSRAFLDPAGLPDEYAMRVVGDCLAPAIKEGDAVVWCQRSCRPLASPIILGLSAN